jgi:hypothetical protein
LIFNIFILTHIASKGYGYAGCYGKELYTGSGLKKRGLLYKDRLLEYTDPNKMTPARCSAICYQYPYFALFGGSTCYCGNQFPTYLQSESTCNQVCSGNASQICGGSLALSVYLSTTGIYIVLDYYYASEYFLCLFP